MTDGRPPDHDSLIPKHGGYRKLKSFQLAQLVYDLTVRFCNKYISIKSRTHDQMLQAARSGVQNIAEGSQASGTSKKTELKLTNVARASLEELRLDYEDYLRQHNLTLWGEQDSRRKALVDRRCQTAEEVADWVREQHAAQREQTKQNGLNGHNRHDGQNGQKAGHATSDSALGAALSITSISPISSMKSIPSPEPYACLAANTALVLIGVACSLLDKQIKSLADSFEQEGGFTEKLYKTRQTHKNRF